MTSLEHKRIRVDWEELEEAFSDSESEHRYYLDRETGAVHFFSTYLDNEEEEDDERSLSEKRYALIPRVTHSISEERVAEFVASLKDAGERRALLSGLRAPGGHERFRDAVERLPDVRAAWDAFSHRSLEARIREWLSKVNVEPL